MSARFLVGDVHERLAELPASSIDLVLTSPPFLALRSYLPADHPDKHREIGSESTPADYLDMLLKLTAEWGRVLAPHGSIAVELGDTYCGAGGYGSPDSPNPAYGDGERFRERWEGRTQKRFKRKDDGWPLPKSLTGIPTLYAWSLAYGRNLLTGQYSPAGQWRIRNLIAWVRPNPPVGALADKYRPATSYITVATRARDRWFDLDAVRTPSDYHRESLYTNKTTPPGQRPNGSQHTTNPAGAPPLDWWEIPPGGYSGAHYAVFPPELPRRLIDSMCPRRVCNTCGQPSRRITSTAQRDTGRSTNGAKNQGRKHESPTDYPKRTEAEITTLGWTVCGCPDTYGEKSLRLDGFHAGVGWRPGVVLDPFVGSGTTLAVASGMGRDSIGIDLDSRNADLARERVGMFLDVDEGSLFEEANRG